MSNNVATEQATEQAIERWRRLKTEHPTVLLLLRVGADFYETFGEDARLVARECELTTTSRTDSAGEAMAVCGIPCHALDRHVSQLVSRRYRCAVCDA